MSIEATLPPVTSTIDDSELLELTRRLVATPSQCGIDDELAVAEVVAAALAAGGVEAELREVQPGRPNVVARIAGTGDGPAVMLNGHLDTTPMDIAWTTGHEVTVTDGVVRGHGARNMKGGIAAVVAAAAAIRRSDVPPPGDVWITGVMGHHQGGLGTRALLDDGLAPAYTVIPEPTDLGVRTVQTGSISLDVTVTGRTGPAGGRDLFEAYATPADQPADPLLELPRLLRAVESIRLRHTPEPRLPALPMIQVRQVISGYGPRQLAMAFAPDTTVLRLGVYTAAGQDPESVRAEIEAALWQAVAGTGLRVSIAPLGPRSARNFLDVPEGSPAVTGLVAAHRAVTAADPEVGTLLPHSYFGCDGQILAMRGLTAISYGPASHAYRYANRGRVTLDDIAVCARTLALAPYAIAAAHADG